MNIPEETAAIAANTAFRVRFTNDGVTFKDASVADHIPVGGQTLNAAGIHDIENYTLFAILPNGEFEDVHLDETFDLRGKGTELFAYFYGIPLIDVGLRMVAASETHGYDLNGRVTTVLPGRPCLICSGVVSAARASEEDLERTRLDEFQKRKEEAYVMGAGDPAPAVVTFITEMASVAINEMIAAITGFHSMEGMITNRVRRWHALDDCFNAHPAREGCPVCNSDGARGAGDVNPFLDVVG
jgi:hypothetical protein